MRFKTLTATILRNAAIRVEENSLPMCWAIRTELQHIGFELEQAMKIVRVEFEKLLTEMDVPNSGWLWLDDQDKRGRKWDTDPELREARVMFLLMLADAVAYKSKRVKPVKSTDDWIDGSIKPEKPGVYEREFDSLDHVQFGYFDGVWYYGSRSVEDTLSRFKSQPFVAINQNRRWKHIEQKPANLVSFSVNPVEPGVYAVVNPNADIPHCSKWDGKNWCITTDDVINASLQFEESPTILNPRFANDPVYIGWYATRLDT
jgi:hypothetical protein